MQKKVSHRQNLAGTALINFSGTFYVSGVTSCLRLDAVPVDVDLGCVKSVFKKAVEHPTSYYSVRIRKLERISRVSSRYLLKRWYTV